MKRYVKLFAWYSIVILLTKVVTVFLYRREPELAIVAVMAANAIAWGLIHAIARLTYKRKPKWRIIAWYMVTMLLTSWMTCWRLHRQYILNIEEAFFMVLVIMIVAYGHYIFSSNKAP